MNRDVKGSSMGYCKLQTKQMPHDNKLWWWTGDLKKKERLVRGKSSMSA
jgi:hypothetical protein